MDDISKEFGEFIREERTYLGWSKKRLAKEAGCHPNSIIHYENGGCISLSYADRLCSALGVEYTIGCEKEITREDGD